MVRPSAAAVLRLMTKSKPWAAAQARWPALAPLRSLSTWTATPRHTSAKFAHRT